MKGYPLAGTRGRGDAGTRGREERFDLTRALGESRAELGFSRGGVAKFLDEGDVVATRAKGVVARARGGVDGVSLDGEFFFNESHVGLDAGPYALEGGDEGCLSVHRLERGADLAVDRV